LGLNTDKKGKIQISGGKMQEQYGKAKRNIKKTIGSLFHHEVSEIET